ncbi:hypothetical protein PIIN_09275, partial [Serendipita indica DSM 11827]
FYSWSSHSSLALAAWRDLLVSNQELNKPEYWSSSTASLDRNGQDPTFFDDSNTISHNQHYPTGLQSMVSKLGGLLAPEIDVPLPLPNSDLMSRLQLNRLRFKQIGKSNHKRRHGMEAADRKAAEQDLKKGVSSGVSGLRNAFGSKEHRESHTLILPTETLEGKVKPNGYIGTWYDGAFSPFALVEAAVTKGYKPILAAPNCLFNISPCLFLADAVKTWFPNLSSKLAEHHQQALEELWSHKHPTNITFNVGDCKILPPHCDAANISYGICAVMPVGLFEPSQGGHLVLHKLKIVLEVQPGNVVFLPSALIMHSNIPLPNGAKRQSVVWWSCGKTI